MKKFVTMFVLVLVLTGCSLQKEPDVQTEQFSKSGVFQYCESTETGRVVSLDCDGELVSINAPVEMNDFDSIQTGYIVTVSGLYDVTNGVYSAESVTIDSVPLEIQLGFDGYDLMCQEYDYNFSSLLTQVKYTQTRKYGGREYRSIINTSSYIDQDENASYVNVIQNIITEDGVDQNHSILEYIDKREGSKYTLLDYGTWEKEEAADTSKISYTMDRDSISVNSFYEEGSSYVVEGVCNSVPKASYLDTVVTDTIGALNLPEDTVTSFVGKFDKETKLVKYIVFNITSEVSIGTDNGAIHIDKFDISMNSIKFDNVSEVKVPDHLSQYGNPPIPTEEPVPVTVAEALLGITPYQVTYDYIVSILPEQYNVEGVFGETSYESVIESVMDILLNEESFYYTVDVSQLPVEQQLAMRVINDMAGDAQ